MTAQYFRFTPDVNIKSSALAPWGGVPSGVVSPQWYYNNAVELANGTLRQTPVSGIASGGTSGTVINVLAVPNILSVPNILGSLGNIGSQGYIAARGDGASGSYLLQHNGFLIDYSVAGALIPYQDTSNAIFKGLTVSGTTPWMVDVSGHVFTVSGSNIVASGNFGQIPTYGLTRVNQTLWTVAAAVSGIASYNFATAVSGVVTTPMKVPAIIAASGSLVAVAGWSTAQFLGATGSPAGFYSLAIDPLLPNIAVGGNSDTNAATVWHQDAAGNWTVGQSVASLAQFFAWNPNGTQLLAATPAAASVYAFTFILGTLALQATFSVTGANWVAFSANGNEALVASPTANTLTSFVPAGSGWAVSGVISAPTPSALTTFGDDSILVGHASGVTQYNFAGGHWTAGAYTPFPFTVTSIALDVNSGIVVGGVSGANAFVSYAGSTLSYSGEAGYVLYRNGQIIVNDRPNRLVRVYGVTNNVLSLQSTTTVLTSGTQYSLAAGPQTAPTIYVYGTGGVLQYHLAGPYAFVPQPSGAISIYNTATSGFVTVPTKLGHQPEAMAWDPSGNLSVVTLQNTMWTIGPTGTVLVSGAQIAQFSGQPSGTPIGISHLLWVGNALYGSSILNDSVVQVQ